MIAMEMQLWCLAANIAVSLKQSHCSRPQSLMPAQTT